MLGKDLFDLLSQYNSCKVVEVNWVEGKSIIFLSYQYNLLKVKGLIKKFLYKVYFKV